MRHLTANGTRPLPRGSEDPTLETGFLSGSAGAAYMFLDRYARDRDPADLATARRLLGWVNAQAVPAGAGGLCWPLALATTAIPAGFELGAAGIAWVNLRASRSPATAGFREVARRAGSWLRSAAIAGSPWNELPGDATVPVHVGLDSGAAGIGWVLARSCARWSRRGREHCRVRSALAGLRDSAAHDRHGAFWYEIGPAADHGCAPSRHGTGARPGSPRFAARVAGWSGPGPGGQRAR